MPQSYKTNQRFFSLVPGGRSLFCFFLCLLLTAFQTETAEAPATTSKRTVKIFQQYEYRFLVPSHQVEAVWQHLVSLQASQAENPGNQPEISEENLTDVYFDGPNQELLNQNLALRQRLYTGAEGQKKYVQLLMPPPSGSQFGTEARFRPNRRPDKGKSFTAHPVLQLLRAKDRPYLDSLLRLYQIQSSNLKAAFEVNQERKRLFWRKNGNEFMLATLARLQIQTPEQELLQLQLQADPAALTQATPAEQQKMMRAVNGLAQNVQRKFPDLKGQKKQEYALMAALQKRPPPQHFTGKILLGAGLLALLTGIWLVRNYKRRSRIPFE